MPPSDDYRFELIASEFSFPTSLTFDDEGVPYVAESGLSFGEAEPGGRIWRVGPGRERTLLAGGLRAPVSGLTFHQGSFYISEGGYPARISRLDEKGVHVLLDNLPGPGRYHTNMVAFGPDGKMYFSQGAMTNSGIVGLDAYESGWLRRQPEAHDLPGYDVVLTGVNAETRNPLSDDPNDQACTGAFVPFGTPTEPGQRIAAVLPCTAAVMRCNPDGSELELVAWGLRNAYGLGFTTDGRLLATERGPDEQGSRPIGHAPDLLFEVKEGAWYGWPDFIGGVPVTDMEYSPARGEPPSFLLANHETLPPPEPALLRFPPHAGVAKFDVAPPDAPRWAGQLFVALFGDEEPMSVPFNPPVGRTVLRVDPIDWSLHPLFALTPLTRPIDVRFGPDPDTLYILDFGHFEMEAEQGVVADAGGGKLWRVEIKG
ncbi:MAG: PQQ-dependent sugar dehydrogenase [Chloroflexota bacterium]|nr:PQQ-dependent sugar dehydrogenase [Chloroflexota bacterium]